MHMFAAELEEIRKSCVKHGLTDDHVDQVSAIITLMIVYGFLPVSETAKLLSVASDIITRYGKEDDQYPKRPWKAPWKN